MKSKNTLVILSTLSLLGLLSALTTIAGGGFWLGAPATHCVVVGFFGCHKSAFKDGTPIAAPSFSIGRIERFAASFDENLPLVASFNCRLVSAKSHQLNVTLKTNGLSRIRLSDAEVTFDGKFKLQGDHYWIIGKAEDVILALTIPFNGDAWARHSSELALMQSGKPNHKQMYDWTCTAVQ